MNEDVFDLRIRNAVSRHLAGEPFVTIDINLDGERKPCLQPDMHEAEFLVYVVEIQAKAARHAGCKPRLSLPIFEFKTGAGFHDGKYADQSLGNTVTQSNLMCALFFAYTRIDIFEGATGFPGGILRMSLKVLGITRGKMLEILEQDSLSIHKPFHTFGRTDGEISLEHNAIKTGNHSRNLVLMLYNK